MTQLSNERILQLFKEAESAASHRWPLYGVHPARVAFIGFVASYLHLFIFFVVAGLDFDSFIVAQWVYYAHGAVIPAIVVWTRERTHYRHASEEFERLKRLELERRELDEM